MPHTITYNSELHILEVKIQGDYFAAEAQQLLLETMELVKKHNCLRILTDLREAKINLSTMEIYNAPRNITDAAAVQDVPAGRLIRAIVIPAGSKDAEFLEDVAVNRGHRIKLFQDIDEAKEWLLK